MERIIYRKTLDVHKNGIQFQLNGFETVDKMSRIIEVSLMASGDAIDFPLERIVAMMYVTTPSATEPSINKCTIKDNKVVYEVLPITEEGITEMQIKLIEVSPEGATSVLASPKFSVEVVKSNADDESAEQTTTFTALEEAMANAKIAYDERFLRLELDEECIFKAWYADGTYYETDVLQRLFKNGNVLLSESYAKGGTGVRAGEDTDNSKYYSNVSRSEALNAKDIMENSRDVLDEVRLHGMYTAFSVDFTTGEVEYVSPSSKFVINRETGELDAIGQSYTFNEEIGRVVTEWLLANEIRLEEIQDLADRVTPMDKGGTGATNAEESRKNLDVLSAEEVCSEDTYELFGLPAESTPNDIFDKMGKDTLTPQFISGSYVGDGTWGMDNPTKIPCPFQPELLYICTGYYNEPRIFSGCFGKEYTKFSKNFTSTSSNSKDYAVKYSEGYIHLVCDENITDNSNISAQYNTKDTTYTYFILGTKGGKE